MSPGVNVSGTAEDNTSEVIRCVVAALDTADLLNYLETIEDENALETAAGRLSARGQEALSSMVADRLRSIRRAAPELLQPIGKPEKRFLEVRLTEDEVAQRSRAALELYSQAEKIRRDLKEYAKEENSRASDAEGEAKALRRTALAKAEHREVDVVIHWNGATGEVWEVRTDTNEVTLKREPTAKERQMPLAGA